MSKWDDLLRRILAGNADANISFDDLRALLIRLGFEERIRSSHHILRLGATLINLQRDGRNAKVYQVRQVRAAIIENGLTPTDKEENE